MATTRPPAPRPSIARVPFPARPDLAADHAELSDYREDGRWDCSHAFEIDDFEKAIEGSVRARKTDPQGAVGVVASVWTPTYLESGFEEWAAQNDLDGHPRAREAYEAWSDGWKACAVHRVGEIIHERWDEILAGADLFFITDEDGDELERFDDINEALLVLSTMPPESRLEMEERDGPTTGQRALLGWISPHLDNHNMHLALAFSMPVTAQNGRSTPAANKIARAIVTFPTLRAQAKAAGFRRNPSKTWNNPAWVTKTLATTFETMEHGIPAKWLPRQDAVGARGARLTSQVNELGCGSYGCALPTLDPNVVLKITTDQTEAEFAEKLSKTLVVPIVVRYEAVMTTEMKHQGLPITLLWREEAKNIGELDGKSEDLVANQHAAAQHAYELVVNKSHGAELNAAFDNWKRKTEAMKESAELEWLARGLLRVFKEQGVFLGDIHAGNLGKARRDGVMRWLVTDPGHVAVIRR